MPKEANKNIKQMLTKHNVCLFIKDEEHLEEMTSKKKLDKKALLKSLEEELLKSKKFKIK